MNYGNRNASTPYTKAELAQSYVTASACSMAIAIVSRTMVADKLKNFKGSRFLVLNAMLNFLATSSTGALNCVLMRWKETKIGVDITNQKGDIVYGKSREAGKQAVIQTGLSRAFLPAIPFFLPGVIGSALMTIRLYPSRPMS